MLHSPPPPPHTNRMDWTDVHYRALARILSRRAWLYTEMIVDQTLVHTDNPDRFLAFPPEQRPIVCQLGGSDPATLAAAASIVARYNYDEINLNCGCPSPRVAGAGCFGAKLMLDPPRVAAAVAAMAAASPSTPITVKCRLGVDDVDSYEALTAFVGAVAAAGVRHFIIHARACLLDGLSPAQNRTVPPLRHAWVYALARDFPGVRFSLNGGVGGVPTVAAALSDATAPPSNPLAGVMVGRAAYHDSWNVLAGADVALWGEREPAVQSRREALTRYASYAATAASTPQPNGYTPPVRTLFAPLLRLTHGVRGGRRWRAAVDAALRQPGATVASVLATAEGALGEGVLDEGPPDLVGLTGEWAVCELPPKGREE